MFNIMNAMKFTEDMPVPKSSRDFNKSQNPLKISEISNLLGIISTIFNL